MRSPTLLPLIALLAIAAAGSAKAEGDAPSSCASDVGRDFASATVVSKGMSPGLLVARLKTIDEQKLDVRGLLLLKDCALVLE
jgi:hypothetical protein